MTILTIDVGNSNVVLGLYVDDKLDFISRISSDTAKTDSEYAILIKSVLLLHGVDCASLDGIIMASVVPSITKTLRKAILLLTGKETYVVGPGMKTGINILIDDPAQLGSDLLVGSVAASALYKKPVIIADMGTATTICVVDAKGGMRGGAILPGVIVSLNALVSHTAQLQQVGIEAPKKVIGTNTIDCIKSGVVYGAACMLDGMISRIEAEIGTDCTTVATGGLAEEICKHTTKKIIYNPTLLLEGLYILYKKNFIK